MPVARRISELSFKSMPPLFVPLRFFLSAPWFGILASLLLMFYSDSIFLGRWTPEVLALTHLFTIGFMLMSMIGALLQFIPIISGYAIPRSSLISPLIHLFLSIGCLFLALGFLLGQTLYFQISLFSLSFSLVIFVASMGYLLHTLKNKTTISILLMLANFALLMTISFGIYMLISYAFSIRGISIRGYTNIHLLWGLIAWTVVLILAVNSQIIPMFYVTPAFNEKYLKYLSISIIICLVLLTILDVVQISSSYHINIISMLNMVVKIYLSLLISFFSIYSLKIINKRKRKITDVTINFWKLALLMPILAVILYGLNLFSPFIDSDRLELLLGVVLIFGFAVSAIMGMMQKIVPFIIFMHLQTKIMLIPEKMHLLPNMQTLISVKNQQIQYYLHIISLLFLIASLFINSWIIVAATAMLFDFSWLAYQLHKSVRQYQRISYEVSFI